MNLSTSRKAKPNRTPYALLEIDFKAGDRFSNNPKALETKVFDLTLYSSDDDLKQAVAAEEQRLAELHNEYVTYSIKSLSDFNDYFTGGVNWLAKSHRLYTLAKTVPDMPTNIEPGDPICCNGSHGEFYAVAIGFSEDGVHYSTNYEWHAKPIASCRLNYIGKAANQFRDDYALTAHEFGALVLAKAIASFGAKSVRSFLFSEYSSVYFDESDDNFIISSHLHPDTVSNITYDILGHEKCLAIENHFTDSSLSKAERYEATYNALQSLELSLKAA